MQGFDSSPAHTDIESHNIFQAQLLSIRFPCGASGIYIYIYVIQFLNNSLLQCKSNVKKHLIVEIACASIAQLLEHALRKHMAAGSIPTGRFVCFLFFLGSHDFTISSFVFFALRSVEASE